MPINPQIEIDWLTAEEAAQHLKVKRRSLLLWVRQGKLPAHALVGIKRRIWRFRRSDLDAVLLANRISSRASSSVRSKD
jgi:excisionase family DNA binding protein